MTDPRQNGVLYGENQISYGAPEHTVEYLVMAVSVRAKQPSLYKNRTREIYFFMVGFVVKFLSPGVPHNFTKKYRRDLKMG